jgi:hypothetical protein
VLDTFYACATEEPADCWFHDNPGKGIGLGVLAEREGEAFKGEEKEGTDRVGDV